MTEVIDLDNDEVSPPSPAHTQSLEESKDIPMIDRDATEQQPTEETSAIDTQTQENYTLWKSNAIQLYSYLNTTNAVWPSMTLQFLPDVELSADGDKSRYRVLSGTFTSGFKPEVVKIGSFQVQNPERKVSARIKFDSELGEFQNIDSISGKFETIQEINHSDLEILRLRYLPQNPNLIASITNSGDILIFDKSKYPSQASTDFKYEMRLQGHTTEGYGLNWNTQKEGHLISSSNDGSVLHWDITKHTSGSLVKPLRKWESDKEGVNDVIWIPCHDSIFVSVGEDNQLKVYDIRQSPNDPVKSTNSEFHNGGINAVSINLKNGFCASSGDAEGTIQIWDIREIEKPQITLSNAHTGSITSLKFNPNLPSILASASWNDAVVNVYDLSKKKEKIIFKHGGHLLGVNDIDWNPNDEWMCGSVSYDNTVQFWKPDLHLLGDSTANE